MRILIDYLHMALTSKQEKYAQARADGLGKTEAYKAAFNTEKMKPETINNSAYKLEQNGDIAARIEQLRQQLSERGLWGREDSVRALKSIVDNPDNQGAIISAVKELNAMHGYNAPVKVDVDSRVVLTLSNADANL